MVGTTLLLGLTALSSAAAAPARPVQNLRVQEKRPDAVLVWNDVALKAIRTAGTPPPQAARHLAMLHIAIADSVNTIYQTHRPYFIRLRATEPIDPEIAVASAAQRVLADLYPKQASTFDRVLNDALAATARGTARSHGLALGRYAADRVLALRQDDGSAFAGTVRESLEVGIWRPTPPRRQAAILPRWGEVTPFGISRVSAIRIPPPPSLGSKEYALDLAEVRRLGAHGSLKRTAEQTIIAWFWEGGSGTCTPPGHWNQIAQEVAQTRETTLPENARLFALLNIALADAAIVCWDCKYRHKLWRPITAIRLADEANAEEEADPRWSPLLYTPAFPSYVSGHSTFSGAGATVLEAFFGTDEVTFQIGSDGYPGIQREFTSFWQAAQEAGRSRIYGGIHFECDNREGLAAGKAIAHEILRTKLLPTDPPIRRPNALPTGSSASQRRVRK